MRAILILARLTVAETSRRRILAVLFALTVVSVALTTWGIERLVTLARDGGTPDLEIVLGVSQVQILVAFMFSFVLAMTAAFVGAPAIGGDLESGVAYAILARPLRRADLLLGRWLGSAVVVAAYAAASGLLAIAVAAFVSGYWPPDPPLAIAFLVFDSAYLNRDIVCLGCHTPDQNLGLFAVAAAMKEVVGPGHGLPPRPPK